MTVSRVINDSELVRPATRERVLAAIDTLAYRPNEAARSLAGFRPVHIAMLYEKGSAYIADILFGSLERARVHRVQFIVEKLKGRTARLSDLQRIVDDGVDALLLAPPLADSPEFLGLLKSLDLPIVVITSSGTRIGLTTVRTNGYEAAREMTRHLVQLGHREIGFIAGNPKHSASADRERGFRDALAENGINCHSEWLVEGRFTYRSGLEAAERILDQAYRPTAIFASNDDMAAATLAVAHRMGIEVPGDLSVCGFDDAPLASSVWPPLTTVHVPTDELSRAAVDLLVEMARARQSGDLRRFDDQVLGYSLVRRQSDAPPRKPERRSAR